MKKSETKYFMIFTIFAIFVLVVSVICFAIYYKSNLDYYITYSEKSDIDYKVYLKKNDYFKTRYLGKNTKYIASIIDYIETKFTYELILPEDEADYKYLYKIIAELKVKDKDDDFTYYEYAEELFNSDVQTAKSNVFVNKKINVDYNKYNDLISGFVDDFDLDRSESLLRLTLKIMILDNKNKYESEIDDKRSISLDIPLTTKTMSISMNSNLNNSDDNKILVKQEGNNKPFLVIGIVWFSISLVMAMLLLIYYFKNRTPLAIYKKKLKSIKNNYSSYIQEIDSSHKIGASVVYKLKTFDDLLEVRDIIQKPILMIHNNKHTGTFFIIPANEYTIYSFALRVVDIVAEKHGIETPDYDVNNLSKETLEEKKITKKYIDLQIDDATRTMTMPKIDTNNIIMGNKDTDEKIYEQLEKTQMFSVSELKKAANKQAKEKKVKNEIQVKRKIGRPKKSEINKIKNDTELLETKKVKRKVGRPRKNT